MDVVNVIGGATGVLAWASVAMDMEAWLTYGRLVSKARSSTITTVDYNTDLNSINSLPTQFKRVEVIQNTGGAGKTVNVFTSPDDYSLWVSEGKNHK